MTRFFVLIVLAGGSFLLNSFLPHTDNIDKEIMVQTAIKELLYQRHFDPKDLDDEFSQKFFDSYIENIDPYKRFLTKSDISSLKIYQHSIDDDIRNNQLTFFNESLKIMEQRLAEAQSFYEEMISSDFDFTIEENYETDPEKREHSMTSSELKKLWKKSLKYDMTSKIVKKREHYADLKEEKTEEEIYAEVKSEVKKNYDNWFKRISKIRRDDRFGNYLNTLTHLFDPHTDYMSPKEKEDFDIGLGGKLEGIGARLSSDGDFTQVTSVVPGGPVWKDKQIEVNDFILKVKDEKDEVATDIMGMRLDDVVQMIRGKKGTKVTLTIKKKDGSIKEVTITRDIVNTEESIARSVIINDEGALNNVGYIDLPKFYSSFEGKNGNSCAADVRKEIEKLKSQNVNGIILDLRNNGGGSLRDVVEMSGLFIEEGPIVQVKPRQHKVYVYNDEDRKVIYDGPLVVMINNFSASASEILAAAMQDYDRAIIVGTNSFGKGTVQRFIDIDRAVTGHKELKPLGNLKITMQKFYRINGGSTQLKGVQPDVVLPDSYLHLDVGEREYDNALEWTSINPLDFNQSVYVVKNKHLIKKNSRDRVKANTEFMKILDQAQYFKSNKDQTLFPLTLTGVSEMMNEKEEQSKKFEDIMKDNIQSISVSSLEVDMKKINFDEKTKARNDEWISEIKKDIYIEESISVLKDIIAQEASVANKDLDK